MYIHVLTYEDVHHEKWESQILYIHVLVVLELIGALIVHLSVPYTHLTNTLILAIQVNFCEALDTS